jgi:hypothetical protein
MNERLETDMVASSFDDYFCNEERNTEEDCGLRLLLRLDGTGVCRSWGGHSELIWRRI